MAVSWTTVSVTEGATSKVVSAALATDPLLSTNWNTVAWVSARDATTFTVQFSVPAPAGATVTYSADIKPTALVGIYETGAQILDAVLSHAGDDIVGSADFETEAKRAIQHGYIRVLESFPWLFNRKDPPAVLNTVAEITTGSVTLTTGSTSGTFSAAPAISVQERKIYTDTDGVVCRIAAHIAGQTAFTLDAIYVGDGGSGLSYHVFQDEYDLATDFLIPVNTTRFLRDCHGRYDMDLIHPNRLETLYPSPVTGSVKARYCAIIREKTLRVAPYPVEARRYEYEYCYHPGTLPFDGTAPDTLVIQPPEDRVVVAYVAAAEVLLDMDEEKWSTFAQAAPIKLTEMKSRQRRLLKPGLFMRPQFAVGTRR